MFGKVKQQQIYLPTGYEGLQKQADSKRRLAERMLASGMAPQANQQSILQVLGQLAQTYVGRRAEKKADALELEASGKLSEDFQNQYQEFQNDAKMLSPDQIVAKWGAKPLAQEWVKPYASAMEAGMKENQQLGYHDGKTWGRKGDVAVGSMKPNDPNQKVIRDRGGNWMLNPVAITGNIASQGIPVVDGTYSMPDPAAGGGELPPIGQGQPQPQSQPQPQAASQFEPVDVRQLSALQQTLGTQGTVAWLKNNKIKVKVTTPEEAAALPPGTIIITPDGQEREVN